MKLKLAILLLQTCCLGFGCYLLDQGSIGIGLFIVLFNGMILHAQLINLHKDE
jgi:hypothetical protein